MGLAGDQLVGLSIPQFVGLSIPQLGIWSYRRACSRALGQSAQPLGDQLEFSLCMAVYVH